MAESSRTLAQFSRIENDGWRLGFRNLLAKENRKWWKGNRWFIQVAIWTGLLDGLLILLLFVIPSMTTPNGQPVMPGDTLQSGVQGLFNLAPIALAMGIIILVQDAVIREKQSGTAEWVLSKPASRYAFILAKVTANTIAVLVTMIAIPFLIAYVILYMFQGNAYPIYPILSGCGLVLLHTFFYMCLTVLVGVLVNNRSLVLAISLGTLLGGSFLSSIFPPISLITPWMLPDITSLIAIGETIPPLFWIPIISTAIWSIIFVGVALWRFQHHEF
ncbi:MAG: ABC transporter permease subunit [Anaerolineales bacterium]|nr:ABC transporter permease subunit [Anaerolineales bacterium]